MTGRNITYVYFKVITFFLHSIAAFPEEKILNGTLKTFLLNKVWPTVFFLIWTPLVPMVSLKIRQFINNKMWDDLLDIMHMFILGCNTLYYLGALQIAARHYKTSMDLVNNHFKTSQFLRLQREIWMQVLGIIALLCFLMCFSANIYYGENLVPLWIPFLDNEKPPPIGAFVSVWFYEGLAGCYMVITYGIVAPFVVLLTSVIGNEISYLIRSLDRFRFFRYEALTSPVRINNCPYFYGGLRGAYKTEEQDALVNAKCFTENDTRRFIRAFVQHHCRILRTIDAVSQIHKYIFFSQAFFTITHSCFLVFSLYYTSHLIKVVLKYSPLLVLSYYLLYMYCWNGQRLTDKCEELHRALYRCQWIGAPRSFKSSLLIMAEYCRRPVCLTGGGVFSASLETFLQGVQQSFSYILILKAMAPERN